MKIVTALRKHLKKKQGNYGRAGAEMQRLSATTGLSVHQLQSIAMKRRGCSAASEAAIEAALGK